MILEGKYLHITTETLMLFDWQCCSNFGKVVSLSSRQMCVYHMSMTSLELLSL